MRSIAIFLTISILINPVYSQEQLGLRLENYAGVSSLSLNPVGNIPNPLSWDIQLVGAGLFLNNNYAFIRQTSLIDLYKNRHEIEFELADDIEGAPGINTRILDFFDDGRKRTMSSKIYVEGPSFVFKLKDQHSIGIFTKASLVAGARKIPNEFSYYKYLDIPSYQAFIVQPFEVGVIGWRELGLNYAFKTPTHSGYAGFGINLRFLQAYEGAFIEEQNNLEVTKLQGVNGAFAHSSTTIGFTSSNIKNGDFQLEKNGKGVAFDLGILQVIDGPEDQYKWRLGVSLTDIGRLKFNRNSERHKVQLDTTVTLNLNDYRRFTEPEDLDEIIRLFSYQTLGDSLASFDGNDFVLSLPAAVKLQADYAFSKNFYLNALLAQRLPTLKPTASRPNLFALTPRFESRWFSASLPLILYNYQDIYIGFAAKLGFIVIGSDNVTSLFKKHDFTGSDLYLAIKVNPFDIGLNLSGGHGKRRFGNGDKAKCYDF